jgi:hypothetical protein
MLNIKYNVNNKSEDQLQESSFSGFSSVSNQDSSHEIEPAFRRYGGKLNMVKSVFEIEDAYDVRKSLDRLDKLNNKSKKIVD